MTAPAVSVTPWATVAYACEQSQDELSETTIALLADSLQLASDVLFNFTGRRWHGPQTDTYRPAVSCGCSIGTRALDGSTILDHTGSALVRLPGAPVVSITEVKIDGAVVDPARYRVDNFSELVYLPAFDGSDVRSGWPCVQDLRRPITDPGTWQVTYVWGSLPPVGGKKAAATLAVHLALACQPDRATNGCRLPSRVTSISRQGVTMAILDPLDLYEQGKTGIPEVDLWVASERVGQQRRGGAVVRPGAHRPHRVTEA